MEIITEVTVRQFTWFQWFYTPRKSCSHLELRSSWKDFVHFEKLLFTFKFNPLIILVRLASNLLFLVYFELKLEFILINQETSLFHVPMSVYSTNSFLFKSSSSLWLLLGRTGMPQSNIFSIWHFKLSYFLTEPHFTLIRLDINFFSKTYLDIMCLITEIEIRYYLHECWCHAQL